MPSLICDLSVRDQLDMIALTRVMLDRIDWTPIGDTPVILPRIEADTDSLLLAHDVILYHCGAPKQPDWNARAWIWRYTLNLTVLSRDPDRSAHLCSYLHGRISAWPYEPGTEFGKIGRIVSNPGFESVSSGDMTSAKSATAWHSTKLIQAASPRG